MLSAPSTLYEVFYSFSSHDNIVLGVVACLIGEKCEVCKDLITFPTSPDFGGENSMQCSLVLVPGLMNLCSMRQGG